MDAGRMSPIEALEARVDQLQGLCARLVEDNAALRTALSTPRPSGPRSRGNPDTAAATTTASGNDTITPAPSGDAGNLETDEPISRRGLLGKAIGAAAVVTAGGAAFLAQTASPAAAANGDAVLAGDTTTATADTIVEDTSTSANAFALQGLISSTSPGGFSAGVRGQNNGTGGLGIGVWGSQNGSGWGVFATSAAGIGVNANGGSGTGVNASGSTGVFASGNNIGVFAQAPTAVSADGSLTGVSASGPTGVSANGTVVGVSASGPTAIEAETSAATGVAVSATSTSSKPTIQATNAGMGKAIQGEVTHVLNPNGAVYGSTAGIGAGVLGKATAGGAGVIGSSVSGTGVRAITVSGLALDVEGKAHFRRSGIATVQKGHTEVTVNLAGVTAHSLVLATLRNHVGSVVLSAAIPSAGSFKIHLSGAPSSSVKVSWLVLD